MDGLPSGLKPDNIMLGFLFAETPSWLQCFIAFG